MEVYRERKRQIFNCLVKQYGIQESLDIYDPYYYQSKKCPICYGKVVNYSEWNDTGYEYEKCINGCYSHTVYSFRHILDTKGFHYDGEYNESVIRKFENQIDINAKKGKKNKKVFWKKKKSQRRKY